MVTSAAVQWWRGVTRRCRVGARAVQTVAVVVQREERDAAVLLGPALLLPSAAEESTPQLVTVSALPERDPWRSPL